MMTKKIVPVSMAQIIFVIFAVMFISSCGNKGPLIVPDPQSVVTYFNK